MSQTLVIQYKIISSNLFYAGKHWSYRNKVADELHQLVYYECKRQKIKPLKQFPVVLSYDVYVKNTNRDWDNCIMSVKFINDGLRHAEIIPDDSMKYLSGAIIRMHKSDEDRIVITFP